MNGRVIDQRHINFIQMLEKEYNVDIKTTADYVEIRNKWISEGCTMPKLPNVQPRGSGGLKRGTRSKAKAWDPTHTWDKNKNPIKWEDVL